MNKTPSPRQRAKAALKSLTIQAGTRGRLAVLLGLTRTTAYAWKALPEDHLRKACEVFGGKPQDYRPDLSAFQIAQAMRKPETQPVEQQLA